VAFEREPNTWAIRVVDGLGVEAPQRNNKAIDGGGSWWRHVQFYNSPGGWGIIIIMPIHAV